MSGRKRRRLSFNPEPLVHEFDFRSPTRSRINTKFRFDAAVRECPDVINFATCTSNRPRLLQDLDDDDLKMELELAEEDGRIARTPKRKAHMVEAVDKVWCQDLRDELFTLGFETRGDADSDRLMLAKK